MNRTGGYSTIPNDEIPSFPRTEKAQERPRFMRDVTPRSAEEAERILVSEEKLIASFRAMLTGMAERLHQNTQDVWLGCLNAGAKANTRFEKLIAELRGEVLTLKDKIRFLQADVAKLKKAVSDTETSAE